MPACLPALPATATRPSSARWPLIDASLAAQDKWSPALQIRTVLISIQALMSAPNPDDPLNNEAAEQWKSNEQAALDQARKWNREYAMNPR